MIPNQRYVLLFSNPIRTRPVGVTRMGDKPVQGDMPIVEYRKRRHALIEQASQ